MAWAGVIEGIKVMAGKFSGGLGGHSRKRIDTIINDVKGITARRYYCTQSRHGTPSPRALQKRDPLPIASAGHVMRGTTPGACERCPSKAQTWLR